MKRIVRLHLFLLQHLPPSACNVLLLLEGEEEEGEGEESLYYTRTSYRYTPTLKRPTTGNVPSGAYQQVSKIKIIVLGAEVTSSMIE